MSVARLTRKKSSIENHFVFPSIGARAIGEPICLWENDKWVFLGAQQVGLFRQECESISDPVVSIVSTKGSIKAITKKGISWTVPTENVFERVVGDRHYYGASYPSCYPVYFGIAMFKILGCFAFCEEDDSVIIFSPSVINPDVYGVEMINPASVFNPFDENSSENPEFQSSPAYSPSLDVPTPLPPEKNEVKELIAEAKELDAESEWLEVTKEYRVGDDGHDPGLHDLSNKRGRISKKLRDLIGPGSEDKVIQIIVVDNKLTKLERRRSSIERDKDVNAASNAVARESIAKLFSDARIKMGVTDTTVPMPIFNPPPPTVQAVVSMPEGKKAEMSTVKIAMDDARKIDEDLL